MTTDNRICFERLTQKFDTLFDYSFEEVSKLKLLNINMIKMKYGISIEQKDHIIKISFKNIVEQKQKMK